MSVPNGSTFSDADDCSFAPLFGDETNSFSKRLAAAQRDSSASRYEPSNFDARL